MRPGSLIEGLFDDVRAVLTPQAQQTSVMGSILQPDTVIRPLTQREWTADEIDKPNTKPTTYRPVDMPTVSQDKAQKELQKNSTWGVFEDGYPATALSREEYDAIINKGRALQELAERWGQEPDVERRKALIRQYDGFYDFANDNEYSGFLREMRELDDGGSIGDAVSPAELSDIIRRGIDEHFNVYAKVFGPRWYRQA